MNPLTWRWLGAVAAIAIALGSIYGLGRSHASAAWEQRWTARESALRTAAAEAQRIADDVLARQTAATREAARRFADAQTEGARLAGANRDLDRRLRDALRRAAVSTACADPASSEPVAAGVDAAAVAGDLSALALRCAEQHDGLVEQVRALQAAWPR